MYQVIARKYRPQSFEDVVGQTHVKTTLRNAIAMKRIAHGYIFSGQRGTGKTTMARILARCLNCIQGPTPNPCGVCASCTEIAAGGAVDVIEIDAASNRGINEMRELRENVRYQPSRDRFKIFIIDEAHQITTEAFNALLKTIEEPPSWAVFILCTTESHKIPATIASRCQHFSFRSVDFDELVERMRWICREEGVDADDEALAVLARAGEGSVRDSLSALDQAIASSGSRLEAADVRALLGAFSIDRFAIVAEALAKSDPQPMLDLVDDLERSGENLQHFARELSRYLRNLMVARIAGEDTRLVAASANERAELVRAAALFSEQDLTRYLNLSLELYRDLQFSLQPRFHLEVGLLRLIYAGRLQPIEEALAALGGSEEPVEAKPVAPPMSASASAPARRAPTPFELDRARKSAPRNEGATALAPIPTSAPPGIPAGDIDWKTRILEGLQALELTFIADALTHGEVSCGGRELTIQLPSEFKLMANADDFQKALRQQNLGSMRIQFRFGDTAVATPAVVRPTGSPTGSDDEVTRRALAHPEVQRFRDLLGGEVRGVRNLKE
jgi:DNA polymerase-3 subunit gamma/tau